MTFETSHFVTLTRHTHWKTGTYGEMSVGNKTLYTCERPWLGNTPNLSCIPEGHYEVVRHESPSKGWCFALVGDGVVIPPTKGSRWGILFHVANWPDELQGCIAPGQALMPIISGGRIWPRTLAVGRSNHAFAHMMSVLPDTWHLHITHAESR